MKIIVAAFILSLAAPATAAIDGHGNKAAKQHVVKKRPPCNPPRRWIEVDALADDAGRPSKVICK